MFLRVILLAAALVAGAGVARASTIMVASYYETGRVTATGAPFNPNNAHIVAHKTLPFGTKLLLRNPRNGKELCVEVQDRGPYVKGRSLDVTRAGAVALGFKEAGHAPLEVEVGGC